MSRHLPHGNLSETDKKKQKVPTGRTLKAFRDLIWPRRGLLILGLGLVVVSRFAPPSPSAVPAPNAHDR